MNTDLMRRFFSAEYEPYRSLTEGLRLYVPMMHDFPNTLPTGQYLSCSSGGAGGLTTIEGLRCWKSLGAARLECSNTQIDLSSLTPFTLSAWGYRDHIDRDILYIGPADYIYGGCVCLTCGVSAFKCSGFSATDPQYLQPDMPSAADWTTGWVHLVFTTDNGMGNTLYANTEIMSRAPEGVVLPALVKGTYLYLNGFGSWNRTSAIAIGPVRIYDRVLSTDEIQRLFLLEKPDDRYLAHRQPQL